MLTLTQCRFNIKFMALQYFFLLFEHMVCNADAVMTEYTYFK